MFYLSRPSRSVYLFNESLIVLDMNLKKKEKEEEKCVNFAFGRRSYYTWMVFILSILIKTYKKNEFFL